MADADANGVRIRYDDFGRDEPAVLSLTGWCAARGHIDAVARKLAPRRVLSLDWRGHGESATPPGDFGAADLVEDALAVIRASGAREVVPVATAHAGWVAIELRKRLGDRVPKLVLVDWIVLDPPPPFLQALSEMQDPRRCRSVLDALFASWLTGSSNEQVARFVREVMSRYPDEMWARAGREIAAAYARHGNPLKALAALDPPLPVLHLYSVPKDEGYLDAQRSFAQAHPWFRVKRLDTLTHFPTIEAPAVVAAAIEEFLGDR